MTANYVSVHGNRLGLAGNGVLRVDGRDFKSGVVPNLGKDIYVDSVTGADTSDGLTPDRALATLDAAFAKCTANKGYVIYVLPNHSETVTGAAGIAHDVAGVSVIGLGHGGQRPTFLMDASTAVTYKITGSDAIVHNLVFNSGHADVVTCIDVQTATDVWIDSCEFGDNTTNENWLTCIKSGTTTDNQCDGLKVTNCKWTSPDAGCLEFIEHTGDVDRLHVEGNYVRHNGTNSPLILSTAGDDLQDGLIKGNMITTKINASAVGILSNNQTDNTGIIAENYVGHLDVAGEVLATGENSGMYCFENRMSGVVTASGYLLPAADS